MYYHLILYIFAALSCALRAYGGSEEVWPYFELLSALPQQRCVKIILDLPQ